MSQVTTYKDYLAEPVRIPNLVNQSAGVATNDDFESIRNEYERKILREVLGDAQYVSLQAELLKQPFVKTAQDVAPTAYVDLVEGSTDETFTGLRELLKNYVFCQWLRITETKNLILGPGKGKSAGFSYADNGPKYADRWNSFVEVLDELREYLDESTDFELPDDFPEYETENRFGL